MARGVQTFHFEFMLCGVIKIDVHCTAMFGEITHAHPSYHGQKLDIEEYCFDDDNDYVMLEDYLKELAQELYDEANMPIILELEN